MLLIIFAAILIVYTQAQSHGAISYSSSNLIRGSLNGGQLGLNGGQLGLGLGIGNSGLQSLGGYNNGLIGGNNGGYGGHYVDYHAIPKYEYKYGVEDPHTGDKKTQHETRHGDHTQGEYSLVEPDGTILNVRYTVVGKSGFNALVTRSGHAIHQIQGPRYNSGY